MNGLRRVVKRALRLPADMLVSSSRNLPAKPTISVVMPVHNALPYLPEALKSLLGQDCDDFEIIALDDASTDGSAAYLDNIDDPRLRVLHCPRQGLTKLLNVGLREAHGPFVARMDADDISLHHRLSVQRLFLETHPDVVALGCQADVIDEDGRLQYTWAFPVENVPAKLALFRNEASFVHPGVMFRRDAVLAVGGYDESLQCAQDRDLWWKLADRGKFYNHPEPLIRYRRHVNSITTARHAEQVRLGVEVTRRYGALYGIDGEQLECFRRVEHLTRWYRAEGLSIEDVLTYFTVLDRILRLAADRWGGEDVEIDRIWRERWEYLVWWLRTSNPPARDKAPNAPVPVPDWPTPPGVRASTRILAGAIGRFLAYSFRRRFTQSLFQEE